MSHLYSQQSCLQYRLRHINKLLGLLVSCGKSDEVHCSESGLSTWGHKYQDWLCWWICLYGRVCWFIHGCHSRAIEFARVALNVTIQWHGSHTWLEIKQSLHDNIDIPNHTPACQMIATDLSRMSTNIATAQNTSICHATDLKLLIYSATNSAVKTILKYQELTRAKSREGRLHWNSVIGQV